MTYEAMLNHLSRQLRRPRPGVSGARQGLVALTHTAQLAGRDLATGTFDWVRHAVALYEAWRLVGDAVGDDDQPDLHLPEPPEDNRQLRWAVMRLSGAVAQALAEAAASEQNHCRREACAVAAALLTEAAACLRDSSVCAGREVDASGHVRGALAVGFEHAPCR